MISLVGKNVSAKIKEQVMEMLASMDEYVPTAAIVRAATVGNSLTNFT